MDRDGVKRLQGLCKRSCCEVSRVCVASERRSEKLSERAIQRAKGKESSGRSRWTCFPPSPALVSLLLLLLLLLLQSRGTDRAWSCKGAWIRCPLSIPLHLQATAARVPHLLHLHSVQQARNSSLTLHHLIAVGMDTFTHGRSTGSESDVLLSIVLASMGRCILGSLDLPRLTQLPILRKEEERLPSPDRVYRSPVSHGRPRDLGFAVLSSIKLKLLRRMDCRRHWMPLPLPSRLSPIQCS